MNEDNIKLCAVAAIGVCAAVVSARSYLRIHREEVAKRQQIDVDTDLDLRAIHTASTVLTERIDRGEIRSLNDLVDGFNNEIAFQKIIIREA